MNQTTGSYTLIEPKTFYSKEKAEEEIRKNYPSVTDAVVITDKGIRFFIATPNTN